MKRHNPDTSNSAYKMVTPEMLSRHHGKIISALEKLGSATYEEIADFVGMERHKIGRRLSELEREQVICKPGNKKPTKSGRMAYCYSLTSHPKTENEIYQYKKGEKTASDYASDLINSTKKLVTVFELPDDPPTQPQQQISLF